MGFAVLTSDSIGSRQGQIVIDSKEHLYRLLPETGDSKFLQYIDIYGLTMFNQLQARDLLEEWEQLMVVAESEEEREIIEAVANVIREVVDSPPHTFLRFEGD